jgi:hypothetical protein
LFFLIVRKSLCPQYLGVFLAPDFVKQKIKKRSGTEVPPHNPPWVYMKNNPTFP